MTMTPDSRGQTFVDFAIGMTVFLLVVGYVFAFIPGLFSPFAPETDSSAIRADRTADFLTEDLLADPDTSGRLNTTCTAVFFDVSGATADDCDRLTGSPDESQLRDLAGLPARTNVNVTMRRNGSVGQYSGDPLTFGPDTTGVSDRVIRSVRVASFDGRDYRFAVSIW